MANITNKKEWVFIESKYEVVAIPGERFSSSIILKLPEDGTPIKEDISPQMLNVLITQHGVVDEEFEAIWRSTGYGVRESEGDWEVFDSPEPAAARYKDLARLDFDMEYPKQREAYDSLMKSLDKWLSQQRGEDVPDWIKPPKFY